MRVRPMQRITAAVTVALASALVFAGCSAPEVDVEVPAQVEASLPEATTQQLQDAVTHAMAATGSSGAIVGVWAPWSGTWVAGLGTTAHGGGTEVSTDMAFRAARATRMMTCDVLYGLAERGTVALDDPVTKWVNGVPDLGDITLENLCDSTSGIGTYGGQLRPLWISNPAREWNPRELEAYGLGHERTIEPGSAYVDSDAGYVILGVALERATGRSASDLIDEFVVEPLDLTGTSLPSAKAAAPSAVGPVLLGYHSLPGEDGLLNCTEPLEITEWSNSGGFTDSGVVSNITDLGHYAQAMATGALLADGVERFDQPVAAYTGAPTWYTADGGALQAGALIGQYGSVPGYVSAVFADPDTGLTVALVLNNSAAGGDIGAYLAWELAAIASKAPAASGQEAPAAGLPWTAQQYYDAVTANAVCPIASPE